jgi:diguanylate cyclase (GGDEF)-like protein
MKDKGLWDERLYVPGDRVWAETRQIKVEKALHILLDDPGTAPPDTILSMNTEEAVILLSELKRRKRSVPDEIAIAYWGDGEEGRSSDPTISCVEYPYYELGRFGGEQFFKLLKGEDIPLETRVKTRIFYGKSCGCSIYETALRRYRREDDGASSASEGGVEEKFQEVADAEGLLDLLCSAKAGPPSSSPFLARWETILERNTGDTADLAIRQLLADLRRELMLRMTQGDIPLSLFETIDIAQIMLDEVGRSRLSRASILTARTQANLNQASLDIIAAQDRASVLSVVPLVAKNLGISSCYLFLLEEELVASDGNARNLDRFAFEVGLWYDTGQRRSEKENRSGSIADFLDEITSMPADGKTFIGKILHQGDTIQGFVLFDLGEHDTRILEGLSCIISAALKSAEVRKRLVTAQDELRFLAEKDSLTGLGNRYSFYRRMRDLVDGPAPEGKQVALMFLDLDGFKPINDSYGHDAGDALLKETASRITEVLGDSSMGIYRLGGDEFTALVRSPGPEASEKTAERLLAALKSPCAYKGMSLRVGASLGCAHFPRDATDPADLVKYADLSMYRAKEAKGSVVVFDRLKDEYFLKRAELAKEILLAVDMDQIEVLFQGMFEGGGTLAGVEALVRWRHPTHGLLRPGDFLDIAVGSNMIVPIETRVLFLACKHARALVNGKGKSSPFMLVNCTKTFFFSPNFIDIVRQAIREADLGPGLLRLGLEERFAFQNTELALSIIGELKSSGVDFAVEGMGGDSSWINFLRELPENTIVKIDRAFVRHIHTSSSDRDFLFRMLAIFESRGLRVAVSGIENKSQRELLQRHNCLFQGFALSEPGEFDRIGLSAN